MADRGRPYVQTLERLNRIFRTYSAPVLRLTILQCATIKKAHATCAWALVRAELFEQLDRRRDSAEVPAGSRDLESLSECT